MTTRHDLDKQLSAFLREGPTDLPDPSFDAVRDRIEQTRQRAVIGSMGVPDMNKFLAVGLGVAAVVLAGYIGVQLLGGPAPGGPPVETTSPVESVAAPSTPADGSLPGGPFVVTGTDDPVQITVDIASSGWFPYPEFNAVNKDDDGLDPPESVGVALLTSAWPAGTGINVYGDPCQWLATPPETAETPDEIAAAFAAQASTNATAPMDVNVGGFAGKAVTLHVPMSFDLPNATREEEFADCNEDAFAFYGVEGETGHWRNAQGAGQIDELWILDVNGSIVILDAAYAPAAPADLVEEMRTLAESATFE